MTTASPHPKDGGCQRRPSWRRPCCGGATSDDLGRRLWCGGIGGGDRGGYDRSGCDCGGDGLARSRRRRIMAATTSLQRRRRRGAATTMAAATAAVIEAATTSLTITAMTSRRLWWRRPCCSGADDPAVGVPRRPLRRWRRCGGYGGGVAWRRGVSQPLGRPHGCNWRGTPSVLPHSRAARSPNLVSIAPGGGCGRVWSNRGGYIERREGVHLGLPQVI